MKGFTLALGLLALPLFAFADRAAAEPTPDEIAAIKANCRSDFMSNCWGVPRGGAEAMQCLKQHMAVVSPGCQQALKAVTAAAPPKAPAPKPAAAPAPAPAPVPQPAAVPAPATPPPATEATAPAAPAQPSTATATPAPAASPAAPAPKTATPAPAPAAPAAAAKAPPAAKAPATALAAPEEMPIIGFIPPRKKLMIRNKCSTELDTYCAGVDYGDGRQLRCLFSNKASLSADCLGALAKLTE